jgi:hypothetical protein
MAPFGVYGQTESNLGSVPPTGPTWMKRLP